MSTILFLSCQADGHISEIEWFQKNYLQKLGTEFFDFAYLNTSRPSFIKIKYSVITYANEYQSKLDEINKFGGGLRFDVNIFDEIFKIKARFVRIPGLSIYVDYAASNTGDRQDLKQIIEVSTSRPSR